MESAKRKKQFLAVVMLLSLWLCGGMGGGFANAQSASPSMAEAAMYPGLSMEAMLGYDGMITFLRYIPLKVTLKNEGADFSGMLSMKVNRNDVQFDLYEIPVSVASGAVVEADTLVQLSTKQQEYVVELTVDKAVVASYRITPTRIINPEALLVALLSNTPQSLSHLQIYDAKDQLRRGELWQTVPLTAATFPTDASMMESFSFLAVDGVDVSTLSQAQQTVLNNWLQKGGIVILGGAAQASAGYPYFQKWTGISAGELSQSADVTPALLSYVKAAEKPFGEQMVLCEMQGAGNVAVKAEQPILDITPVGNGYVMTAAFSLSDRPLNNWQSRNVLWQRLMLTAMASGYQQKVDAQRNLYGRETEYLYQSVMGHIEIPNDSSFLFPLLLLLLFVVLVGFGSYWYLKKKDKREWMWITIPAFSVLFAIAFLILSQATTLKQPVLAISDYFRQDEEGVVTEKAHMVAAVPDAAPMTMAVSDGKFIVADNSNSYYVDETNVPKEPNELRFTYWMGDEPSMTFPAVSPWEGMGIVVQGTHPPQLQIESSCWFENDGLHIQLANKGVYPLKAGHVITSVGYCSVPALLPGQSVDCLLKKLDETDKTKVNVANANGNIPIVDGVMLSKAQQSSSDLYSIFNALTYPEAWANNAHSFPITSKIYQEREMLNGLYDRLYGYWNAGGNGIGNEFHYVVFDDSLCTIPVSLNGKAATKSAQSNIVDVVLKYKPISDSGFVKYGKGTIPVYTAQRDESNVLAKESPITERYRSFRLADKPMFCYVLPKEIRAMSISDIEILPEYVYTDYGMKLYNVQTGQWEDIDLKRSFKDQFQLSKHMSETGEIYVQFTLGLIGDAYADMGIPHLILEGAVQ